MSGGIGLGGTSSGGTSSGGASSGGAGSGGTGSGGTSSGGAGSGGTSSGGTGTAGRSSGGASPGGTGGTGTGGSGDTTPPTVVSIVPANLANGIKSNAQIKLTFSETMNTATVTQALKVGSFAASDLTTTWDSTGKVLTITPTAGFAYATGTTPAGTVATKYTVTLSTSAQDLAGNALAAFSSSFSTLRRISQSIASGTVAEYSDYGHAVGDGPQSCPGTDPVEVGKWSSIASAGTYYIFIPFDTTVMGSASSIVTLESASFVAAQTAVTGQFYSTHNVVLRKLQYQTIDSTVLSATVTDNLGVFSSSTAAQPTMDVHSPLSADISAGTRQELYRLEPNGGSADTTQANFACNGFVLNVVYLSP
jgi:hypothetical protein